MEQSSGKSIRTFSVLDDSVRESHQTDYGPSYEREKDNTSPVDYGVDKDRNSHTTEKRKRKLKKRRDRLKPVRLIQTHANDSSSNSESERVMKNLTKQIEKLEILQRTVGKGDPELSSVSVDRKKVDTACYPVQSTIFVDDARKQYDVVSRSVQTDWSWLSDKKSNSNYLIDQDDMNDILDSLRFGLYGGFDIPKGIELVRRKTTQDILPKQKVQDKNPAAVLVPRTLKVKQPTQENCSRNSAYEKDQRISDKDIVVVVEDDDSNGNISEKAFDTNIRDVSTPTPVGPPAIVKYHGEKCGRQARPLERRKSSSTARDSPIAPPEQGQFYKLCQFCGKEILPVPTEEQIANSQSHQLFCCPEYQHFVKLTIESKQQEKTFDENVLIDITPHAPYGSKVIQKITRDAVAEKIRERELERQRAAVQQANVFSFTRQMKTIQFSLASTKCFADGWVTRPKTPPLEEMKIPEDIFKIEVNSTFLQKAETMNEKFYDNGQRFLTIFPDGTGCCFYPSGNVAVSIISVQAGKYSYIVHANKSYDQLDDSGLLALFEPNGTGICYFQRKRKLKLFLNAQGGIELDKNGGKRKRWQWYFTKGQLTTPPFQPLCFPLNKSISVRLLDQDNIALIFSAGKRCIRFNVGANLKAIKIEGLARFEPDDSEVYLIKKRKEISNVLAKLHDVMRLPKSTRFNRSYVIRSRKNKDSEALFPPIEADVVVN